VPRPDQQIPKRLAFQRGFRSGRKFECEVTRQTGVSDRSISLKDSPKYQQSQVVERPDYEEPVIITVNNVKSAFEPFSAPS
jgi:hypothetical protein